jgi:S-adenosylmethionine:tRNA ribosyltransferase-isomerase
MMAKGLLFRAARSSQKMLVVGKNIETTTVASLPDFLKPGDLLVVNDSGTLPGSLPAVTEHGEPVEIRLVGFSGDKRRWTAVLFGAGDWRTPTENRPAVPSFRQLWVGTTEIEILATPHPRLVELCLGPDPWGLIYRYGVPIQYSYQSRSLKLAEVQLSYGARPWSAEIPSAGRPLVQSLRNQLQQKGIALATLTHAAGISSTGEDVLDRLLPLPEYYELPQRTVLALRQAKRVVAVGTSVVRALEDNRAHFKNFQAGFL